MDTITSEKNAKIIAFAIQKGGAGKTTSSIITAYGLAKRGKRVLLIDLDSQANSSKFVGAGKTDTTEASSFNRKIDQIYNGFSIMEPERMSKISKEEATDIISDIFRSSVREYEGLPEIIYSILMKYNKDPQYVPSYNQIRSLIRKAGGIDILPSNINMTTIEIFMERYIRSEGKFILGRIIDKIKADYDYIILDCPPSLSSITINAFACCDIVIVPASLSYLSLDGFGDLVENLSSAKSDNPKVRLGGILFNNVEDRTVVVRQIKERMESLVRFCNVYKAQIPSSRKIVETMFETRSNIYNYSNINANQVAERKARLAVEKAMIKSEERLNDLNEQKELGTISEEDYQKKLNIIRLMYTDAWKDTVYDEEYNKIYALEYGRIQLAYDQFIDEVLKQLED